MDGRLQLRRMRALGVGRTQERPSWRCGRVLRCSCRLSARSMPDCLFFFKSGANVHFCHALTTPGSPTKTHSLKPKTRSTRTHKPNTRVAGPCWGRLQQNSDGAAGPHGMAKSGAAETPRHRHVGRPDCLTWPERASHTLTSHCRAGHVRPRRAPASRG